MKFKRINEKRYSCSGIEEVLKEIYDYIYNDPKEKRFKDELQYELILRILTYRVSQEFFKQGNTIDNKLDLINIVIDKEELFTSDHQISNEQLIISTGMLRDMSPDGSVETKIVFGRC